MFQVKICGITSTEDALLAAEAGADAIGLNFYEPSPRCISADVAGAIVERLRGDYSAEQVAVLAVFVNASLDDILWTIRDAGLYGLETGLGIQLHGDEPPQLLRDLRSEGLGLTGNLLQVTGHMPVVPVIRALRCRDDDLTQPRLYLEQCRAQGCLPQAVLLDTHAPGIYGGSGQTLNWQGVADRGNQLLGLPTVLAGGLMPDNVAEAIATARPDAVDVASGVESTPGRKDPVKVMAFVARARAAWAEQAPSNATRPSS
jgi:phosphoribosylanthranilate isomerase